MIKSLYLKLAGTKDDELYRLLILAQCDDLHRSMPFLFDRIDNETELLLPDNLLHSDSPVRKMVTEIEESDWKDVEIIGWIYQFYISERKDEVIGKVNICLSFILTVVWQFRDVFTDKMVWINVVYGPHFFNRTIIRDQIMIEIGNQ